MAEIKKKYKKYFERDRSVVVRLTKRDLEILLLVYWHRFLSSEQIVAQVDGGSQGIKRRLHLMYHTGYLDRPRAQLAWVGNHPRVYGLGNKGARVVAEVLDLPLTTVDWTTKNREAKNIFLEHTLLVSQVLTAIRLACRKEQGVEFIEPEEIIEQRPSLPKEHDKALSWKVNVKKEYTGQQKKLSFFVIPDSVFGLRFDDASKAYFFLEADRATMPIKRSNLGRSSFYKKMIAYWDSWKQNLFPQNFGFRNPRLLTITRSNARIKSMIKAQKGIDPRGTGLRMFLFAPEQLLDLSAPERIFEKVWINGREEMVSILD